MAIDQTVDPMAYLEEAMKPKPKTGGDFTPFFFQVKDGQKALIHPLLNMPQYIKVWKHEYFDNAAKAWKFRNVCVADEDGLECQCCADVESMPATTKEEKTAKRKCGRSERMVLPVWLHMLVDAKTGAFVTYKNADGEETPISGPRLLEMKPEYSTILHDLVKAYQHPAGGHDITKYDFKIECSLGSDGFPKYDVTPKEAQPITVEVPVEYLDKAQVLGLYTLACPPKIVGQTEAPAATPAQSANGGNGKVRTAPDF